MNLLCRVIAGAAVCAAGLMPSESYAQSTAPVRQLSGADARSVFRLGAIESVRPLTNGRVLVNDTRFRQLVVFDSLLASMTVAIDSVKDATIRYGTSDSPLVPYIGDSTLFRDANSSFYLVIDPNGDVAHQLIRTRPGQEPLRYLPPRGHDAEGNPIFVALTFTMNLGDGWYKPSDAPIARMNFATRREEQIAVFQRSPLYRMQQKRDANGNARPVRTINPLVLSDDWTVLSDGTVAVVHARDYNVELVQANGKKVATTRLPFEKRKLSNAEKRAEGEARRAAILQQDEVDFANSMSRSAMQGMATMLSINSDSMRKVARESKGNFEIPLPQSAPVIDIEVVPVKQMLDYMPPFRTSAGEVPVIADADARVWIRTTDTTGNTPGETLYDVVNNLGDYVQRVRVPANRTIVGFGKNNVVFLKFQEGLNRWGLERRHVLMN